MKKMLTITMAATIVMLTLSLSANAAIKDEGITNHCTGFLLRCAT